MKCPQVCAELSYGVAQCTLPPGSGALSGNWEEPMSYPGVPAAWCLLHVPAICGLSQLMAFSVQGWSGARLLKEGSLHGFETAGRVSLALWPAADSFDSRDPFGSEKVVLCCSLWLPK